MKRNVFAIILTAMLMLGLTVLPAQAVPMASLTLLDSYIQVGESFDVQVWMDADNLGEELLAFGFDVVTTESLFTYDGYVLGPGFDDDSFGPFNVAGSAFPGIADDDVLLATLSLTAFAVGTDSLSVLGLFDGFFSGAFYEFTGTDIEAGLDITVHDGGAPVPEPGTMLLLGSGLLGLAGLRKKLAV